MPTWKIFLECMTDTGVVFFLGINKQAVTADKAVEEGISQIIQAGCPISLQKGAPPIPVRPICCVPVWVEEAMMVQPATHIPGSLQKKGVN